MKFLMLLEEFFHKSKPIPKKDLKRIMDAEFSDEEKEEVELLFKMHDAGYEEESVKNNAICPIQDYVVSGTTVDSSFNLERHRQF